MREMEMCSFKNTVIVSLEREHDGFRSLNSELRIIR